MTNQEIFIKIIEKAIKSGWKVLGDKNCVELCTWNTTPDLDFVVREREYPDEGTAIYLFNDVIFSHDFAKAFWGEGYFCESVQFFVLDNQTRISRTV